jgi:pyruvate kinase
MPEALENIDKIVAYCDGLMVAQTLGLNFLHMKYL